MFIDFITDLFKFIFYTAAAIFTLASIPFIIAHVAESDEREEYPHSGFCPDCPEWITPEEEAEFCPIIYRAPRGEF